MGDSGKMSGELGIFGKIEMRSLQGRQGTHASICTFATPPPPGDGHMGRTGMAEKLSYVWKVHWKVVYVTGVRGVAGI